MRERSLESPRTPRRPRHALRFALRDSRFVPRNANRFVSSTGFTGTVCPGPPAAPGVFLPDIDPGHTGTVPASCHMCVARLPSAQG